jgi:hypothetical protein
VSGRNKMVYKYYLIGETQKDILDKCYISKKERSFLNPLAKGDSIYSDTILFGEIKSIEHYSSKNDFSISIANVNMNEDIFFTDDAKMELERSFTKVRNENIDAVVRELLKK